MDSLFLPVIEAGMLVLGVVLFVVLTLACEAGFRVCRWRSGRIAKSEA